jgi:PAS domain S-box-containing protein
MVERIRSKDWSINVLGPRENWSFSLRSTLSILLGSRYPMFVWWGPELINLYNDAYMPFLGNRHPNALGESAPTIWSEIWDVVGPQAELVLNTGQATWNERQLLVMQRYGFIEETYFSYAYSPVRHDDGSIAGVFGACTDETERVLGDRRLRTLREIGASTKGSRNVQEACDAAIASLKNNFDLPFAAIYFASESPDKIQKICSGELKSVRLNLPDQIDIEAEINETDPFTPLVRVFRSGKREVLNDLPARIGELHAGPWPEMITTAIVLPLSQAVRKEPAGVFLAALSPRLQLNEQYESFVNLVATQVSTGIADAQAAEAERKRVEALAELDAAKTTFFSNVSHEFRTPLTLMLGPLEDMVVHGRQPQFDELELIHRNGLRLLKLVNSLLDFSRIEAGRMKVNFVPTDLGSFTADLAGVFRSTIESAGLRLIIDCPKLSRPIFVDREMWEEIVLNLISNAFKFTFHGDVEVKLIESDHFAKLIVKDTGIGILEKELPRIFERFHRVENAKGRSFEGSGIGLAMVHELVKMHGGTVAVESEPGKGTTFTVSIPFENELVPATLTQVQSETPSNEIMKRSYVEEALRWLPDDETNQEKGFTTSATEKMQYVLIADDNADMRNYLVRLLGTRYEVQAVGDGDAALKSIRERLPDLLIADVMMPGITGVELVQKLRSDLETELLSIILLSARAGEDSRIEGLQTGADDYIVKPFSARELLARVEVRLEIAKVRSKSDEINRRSMKQLALVTDSASIYLAHCDRQGRYKFVNKPYAERFGLKPEEIIGKHISEVLGNDVYGAIRSKIDEVLSGKPVQFQLELPYEQIGNRFIHCSYAPEFGESGEVVGLVAAITDITEGRRHEMNQIFLLKLSEKIREATNANELFQTVPELTSNYLKVSRCFFNEIDLEKGIATIEYDYHSPELSSLKGTVLLSSYSPVTKVSIMIGKTIVISDTQNDPRTAEQYETAYGPDNVGAYVAIPLMRNNKWVSTFWVSVETPRTWNENEITLLETAAEKTWLAVEKLRSESKLRDQEAERERLLIQEQTLRIELENSSRLKDQFLATVSHELRTPLNSILGYTYLLQSQQMTTAEKESAVKNIYLSAKNQAQIIDDLLDVSRIISGKMVLKPELVKITDVISGTVNIIHHAANAKNIQLGVVFESNTEDLSLIADPNRLQQIFWNLLSNAVKFTPPEGKIDVKVSRDESGVGISVRDTGSGISDEFLPFVFERFRQADNSTTRVFGGLGIGLSIVKHLVELHGGTISAESAGENAGATFTVHLPIKYLQMNKLEEMQRSGFSAQNKAIAQIDLSGTRVLAVDDDLTTLQLFETIYSRAGAEVKISNSARKALEIVKAWQPDVMLCDIAMPHEDGYWLIQQVRALQYPASKTPAIALTALASTNDRMRAQSSGFQLFIAKPAEPSLLLSSVGALVRKSRETFELKKVQPDLLKGKKLLLVEDDLLSAEVFRLALEQQGVQVQFTANALEALSIFRDWIPDVIVSDLGLPDEDGFSLIRKIRSLPLQDAIRIPAIALTGYGKEEGVRAVAEGFQMYLSKPVEPATLITMLASILSNQPTFDK